jgi:hypothetical protein
MISLIVLSKGVERLDETGELKVQREVRRCQIDGERDTIYMPSKRNSRALVDLTYRMKQEVEVNSDTRRGLRHGPNAVNLKRDFPYCSLWPLDSGV